MIRWFSALLVVLALGSVARAEKVRVFNSSAIDIRVQITHEVKPVTWLIHIPAQRSDVVPLEPGPYRIVVFRGRTNEVLATADFEAYLGGSRNVTVIESLMGTFEVIVWPWLPDTP
jgi:hypothetical protein